jgi:hypothetical protein
MSEKAAKGISIDFRPPTFEDYRVRGAARTWQLDSGLPLTQSSWLVVASKLRRRAASSWTHPQVVGSPRVPSHDEPAPRDGTPWLGRGHSCMTWRRSGKT